MQDLAASPEISALLLAHVPVAIAVLDRDMRYLACSQHWREDYSLADRDIVGRSHYEVFPDNTEDWREIHARALAGETISRDLDRFEHADGSVDWMQWRVLPWRERSGAIGGIVIITQVLTDQVAIEQQAKSVNRELELLIDNLPRHAIFMFDAVGRVAIWNAGAERLYGWREAEVLGQPYTMFLRDEDIAAGLPEQQLAEARRSGLFQSRSWRCRKDGGCFLADVTISAIFGEDNALVGYGQVVRDLTREAAAARLAQARDAQLAAILDTVPDAMIVIDEQGLIESFSPTAERMFGYTAAEVLGRNVSMLMPEPDSQRHDFYLKRYRTTDKPHMMGRGRRVMGRRKDGSVFPHELNVGEANGGGRRMFTGFLRDLTAHEKAEAQLRELQSELIHISRVSAMGTMATTLAHELNQPLASVTNYVQSSAALLADQGERVIGMVSEALVEAGREALRAGAIVHRMREFVARGELDHSIEAPAMLVRQAIELAAVGGKYHRTVCEVSVPESLSPVLVDRVQIQQVLLNLVRNAFEAIDNNGKVIVEARSDAGGGMTRFTVADDGPGISLARQEELFRPFSSTKPEGMGLGLSICRTIVEAHGGQLWHEARPGGGTAFHFTVQTAREEAGDG